MGITQIECRKSQLAIQSLDNPAHKALVAAEEGKTWAPGSDGDVDREGLYTLGYRLCASRGEGTTSRSEEFAIEIATLLGKACHTAYAVAAHLGVCAVGVEHIHAVDALVVAYDKQYAVAAYAVGAVTRYACKCRPVDSRGVVHARGVDHDEVVARAVTLDYLEVCHIAFLSIHSVKDTNNFGPFKIIE